MRRQYEVKRLIEIHERLGIWVNSRSVWVIRVKGKVFMDFDCCQM